MIAIKKRKRINYVFELLIVLMALVFCTPILGGTKYLVFVGLAIGIYIAYHFQDIYNNRNVKLLNCVLLYLILVFGYRLFGVSDAAWGNYMHQLGFFLVMLFMLFLKKERMLAQEKILLLAVLGIIAINVVDNIYLSILYPQLNTGRTYMDEEFLATLNAGGSPYYTFVLFCFDICFFVFLNSNRKLVRNTALACAIICAVYICGYCFKASVVVYFFLSLLFIYYAKRTKNQFKFLFVFSITCLLAYITVSLFSEEIVDFVKYISPNERLTTRFVTLVDSEDADANMVTVTGRTSRYLESVEGWLTDIGTFLFGMGDHRAVFRGGETGVGQHSDLLDSLARYGLFGILLLAFIFKYAFNYILSCFDKKYRLQIICILVVFLLCGLTKKIFFPSSGFAIFLLLPLMGKYINK